MGYTRYELTVREVAGTTWFPAPKEVAKHYQEHISERNYPLEDLLERGGEVKWYEHDEEVKNLSRAFPGLIFRLYGEGEEAGDLWVKYYHSGQHYEARCDWKPPEYDERWAPQFEMRGS